MRVKFFYTIALFLLLTSLFFSCRKECQSLADCVNDTPEWCNLVDLSNEYAPVCGCDCITYRNSGYAECVGGVSSYTEGKCD